ncbi:Rieske (2Fe-2S) protein [Algoriphagus mannitolivorans]|uniref:Rieske (2Fe-2S) protein n=1 Tax=Algoriphagus mannitolivorans TaxID=226504 RepID=UPI000411FE45|nr:Rieske 2Fe-2S domain-containing protein [Algoriphagus mannitolivorans]
MKEFTLGTKAEDILRLFPEGRVKKVLLGQVEIGILRKGNSFFGFELFCPHRGASLLTAFTNSSGELICPLHEYRFDLKTGQVKSGSCRDLKTYSCKLTEHGLVISIPENQ